MGAHDTPFLFKYTYLCHLNRWTMLRIFLLTTLLLCMVCSAAAQLPSYFKNFKPLADSLSSIYHIPSSVILAVAYIESGGGTSGVAKNLNNHFGIVGDCQYTLTHYKSRYRYFPSIRDSYLGFCNLIASKKFYPTMLSSNDPKLWLRKIAATGYAADANQWTETVYGVILKNRL